MNTLTAKSTINFSNMNNGGLWTRFKKYLLENQQIILTGMAMINGNSFYAYNRILNK